jgi:hypothetical protein
MSPPKVGAGAPRVAAQKMLEQVVELAATPIAGKAAAKVLGHALADQFTPGKGLGTQGLADPNVAAAARKAAEVAEQKVDWRNPAAALDKMAQIDANASDGNDPVRCGAATLMAGAVLLGPDKFQKGLQKVLDRAEKVATAYEKLADQAERHGNPQLATKARALADECRGAAEAMMPLVDSDPKSLTHGDLARIQDTLYTIAGIDQRLTANGRFNTNPVAQSAYLMTDAVVTYRDLMWGRAQPKMGGEKVHVEWVDNQNNGGHFVLADRRGKVAYNPWPDADGTAFSRGVDGPGPRIVRSNPKTGELVGRDVDSFQGPDRKPAHLGRR